MMNNYNIAQTLRELYDINMRGKVRKYNNLEVTMFSYNGKRVLAVVQEKGTTDSGIIYEGIPWNDSSVQALNQTREIIREASI